ncbi:hypothetical protein BLNAU_10500 [Blattamonas nauphoetae]|uniref:Uncharacterized protein n=1 Tax=Blattamonas nauphoetae TaxID=2049346 RepID=A0ABQ9XSE2_9EUKA|nr:hypothetical protein BLNAU_10500 [Blattamonas nauphoetae]
MKGGVVISPLWRVSNRATSESSLHSSSSSPSFFITRTGGMENVGVVTRSVLIGSKVREDVRGGDEVKNGGESGAGWIWGNMLTKADFPTPVSPIKMTLLVGDCLTTLEIGEFCGGFIGVNVNLFFVDSTSNTFVRCGVSDSQSRSELLLLFVCGVVINMESVFDGGVSAKRGVVDRDPTFDRGSSGFGSRKIRGNVGVFGVDFSSFGLSPHSFEFANTFFSIGGGGEVLRIVGGSQCRSSVFFFVFLRFVRKPEYEQRKYEIRRRAASLPAIPLLTSRSHLVFHPSSSSASSSSFSSSSILPTCPIVLSLSILLPTQSIPDNTSGYSDGSKIGDDGLKLLENS